jgi:hypothetical protein
MRYEIIKRTGPADSGELVLLRALRLLWLGRRRYRLRTLAIGYDRADRAFARR